MQPLRPRRRLRRALLCSRALQRHLRHLVRRGAQLGARRLQLLGSVLQAPLQSRELHPERLLLGGDRLALLPSLRAFLPERLRHVAELLCLFSQSQRDQFLARAVRFEFHGRLRGCPLSRAHVSLHLQRGGGGGGDVSPRGSKLIPELLGSKFRRGACG